MRAFAGDGPAGCSAAGCAGGANPVSNRRAAGASLRSQTRRCAGAAFPLRQVEWYSVVMGGTYNLVVGDRGRLVVPVEVRERVGLEPGTPLVLLETPSGLVLLTRQQLRDRVRAELAGLDLVSELLAERRAAASVEDAA